ncbi:hypothetical protein DFA_01037 [Cavenderia fasciculata]|uniref:Transmembrane protein n=1 Tax=Cavenderia fasciculata TaxID=261658 RepID=F4PQJ5_CACFS|nr:uncharacterized protein DFA_01037 [Cavenderia fasciculata]EGG21162.1 hypothetical protein DFA_01037 [Cavenderia fasciculata]|eukprot:XP_004359012.1 hypothetical protein DFA_01037 [Cavenderia fasciculata]
MESEPLFGERRTQTKAFEWIVGLGVTFFTIFSVAVGVYFGIKTAPRYLVLVVSLIFVFLSTALLIKWYRDTDDMINPKFKWLVALLLLCTILVGIAVNVSVWAKLPPPQPVCNGLYLTSSQTCIPYYNKTACAEPLGCYQIDVGAKQITCISCYPSCGSSESSSSDAPVNGTHNGEILELDVVF